MKSGQTGTATYIRRLLPLVLALFLFGCSSAPEIRKDDAGKPGQENVAAKGPDIAVSVTPQPKKPAVPKDPAGVADVSPALIHLLGLAVTPFEGGRSQLTIVTDKKAPYKVEMKGAKKFVVSLEKATVAPLLIDQLDAMPPQGAVESVKILYATKEHRVTIKITLTRMVPYHVNQDGRTLRFNFTEPPKTAFKTTSQPSTQTGDKPLLVDPPGTAPEEKSTPETTRAAAYENISRDYAGQKMSFDFVDTDIRNILQLIADVADLNIVWGNDVEGKVSMRLDNVPWDQALEMVLKPNGLTYQIENDVLWVVPKATLVDMEIKERNRKSALLAQKRLQGIFEPKILEYLIIKHRKAEDIYLLLVGNPNTTPPTPGVLDIEAGKTQEKEKGEEETGKTTKIVAQDIYITYDPGTNMIIANGVRSKVEKVKELIARLDVPEKQVMIEARIVEATTGFTRDLGVQWRSLDRENPGFKREWYNTGSNSTGSGEFSTNSPAGWSANIGLALGWLTNGGLGTVALDASLALGETNNEVQIISAPRVLTMNGETAVISRGEIEYFRVATLDRIGFEQIPALLSLTVTPTVSADNSHVTLAVDVTDDRPKESKVAGIEGGEESPPGRIQKAITTKLMVRNGDTVVIGGIFQEIKDNRDAGVPWLKDVPLLGWLFKAEHTILDKRELLIFLTPTVVKTTGGEMAETGRL